MTTVKDLKGFRVIDKDGTFIGKFKDIDFNLVAMRIQSIIVHQGFFRHDTKIMVDYIDKITDGNIILSTPAITKLIGKKVVDSSNEYIGRVVDVTRVGMTNALESITVRTRRPRLQKITSPLPGGSKPLIQQTIEETPTKISISEFGGEMRTETVIEDITVDARFIDKIGKEIILNKEKAELHP
jgi:sporulation protein YlmC with PRC-barrel domain